MRAAFYVLFGAAFFAATALALGTLLLRGLTIRLYRIEERLFGFVTGSAVLSAIIFVLCAFKLVHKGVFLALGAASILTVWRMNGYGAKGNDFPSMPRAWRFVLLSVVAVFGTYYFVTAWAPENSPDGMTYHLWVVAEYSRAHGFVRIPTSFYANLSQGLELLFLYAFQFGKQSAAALVHFTFLLTLPFLIVSYGRRFGFPRAGVAAALFVFVAPVVGFDGSIAYVDVALATIIFAMFYLLQIWEVERHNRLLVPAGILAGFAFAIKYTGAVAVAYALGFVVWKSVRAHKSIWRPLLTVAAFALVFMLPWIAKNWFWVGNPVPPFANRWFPNPWTHIWFENEYRRDLQMYELKSWKQIPLQVTVYGVLLAGLVGPLYLAAPLGLLALRRRAGRVLLLAAVIFLTPYFGNIGTRFLLPCLPFVALAMALVFESVPGLLLPITLVNAAVCFPLVVGLYAPDAWHLSLFPYRAALRLKSEDVWLNEVSVPYRQARLIEEMVPPGEKVFTFSTPARAYIRREVLVKWESSPGEMLGDILWMPAYLEFQPRHALDFRFPARELKKLRLIQTAKTQSMWNVAELRIYANGAELPRAAEWRLTARPNPWQVQLAFDDSPVTRWRSFQAAEPGMYIEVNFGIPLMVDGVKLQRAEDGGHERVDGMDAGGRWTTLSGDSVESAAKIAVNLRRAATDEVKRRGYHYLWVDNNDYGADDYFRNSAIWGLTLLGERAGSRLYRID
jgi:hypothetical protein